jgi:hypothetical protein
MQFAGINTIAVIVAAAAAWAFGAAYYGVLAKPWMAACGRSEADMKKHQGTPAFYVPFVLSFVAELIMAWVLAGVIGHLGVGQVTLRNGVVAALFVWLGFVLTTIATNYAYGGKKPLLTVIDAGHWLGVLILMGAILGTWGVR